MPSKLNSKALFPAATASTSIFMNPSLFAQVVGFVLLTAKIIGATAGFNSIIWATEIQVVSELATRTA